MAQGGRHGHPRLPDARPVLASYEDASAAVATPTAGAVFGGLQSAQVEITGLFSDIE
ncbi:hypothetical protein ACIA5C_00300 [Actinoplanes sp. NPDC051343]|uniref:hypothetical protein n=1 Tax=Actinoplanes sp. NPDC051343 TaxID=3363906 RepID=UPI0037A8FFA4